MKFLVLRTATKFLLVLMLLYSIFILFRGHNQPGGGFIAALITASAYALYLMAHGPMQARQLIFIDLRFLLAIGISCAVFSGLISLLESKNFLSGIWVSFHIENAEITLGTPLLFDIGVYLSVVSSILMTIFALEEK